MGINQAERVTRNRCKGGRRGSWGPRSFQENRRTTKEGPGRSNRREAELRGGVRLGGMMVPPEKSTRGTRESDCPAVGGTLRIWVVCLRNFAQPGRKARGKGDVGLLSAVFQGPGGRVRVKGEPGCHVGAMFAQKWGGARRKGGGAKGEGDCNTMQRREPVCSTVLGTG